jgi:hypothetical protein
MLVVRHNITAGPTAHPLSRHLLFSGARHGREPGVIRLELIIPRFWAFSSEAPLIDGEGGLGQNKNGISHLPHCKKQDIRLSSVTGGAGAGTSLPHVCAMAVQHHRRILSKCPNTPKNI